MYKASVFDTSPLSGTYALGPYVGSCGPENCWKVFDCLRKQDNRPFTLFLFEKKIAEKLHKPRRKETITEILRSSARQLERLRHPKILQIITPLEECPHTLAFVTEPIIGSLNYLKNDWLELELKYGFLQITEALQFLHYSARVLHRNLCPSSVFVNKRGVWKLGGLEFVERCNETSEDPIPVVSWTSRLPKMAQPDLDYTAPEVQKLSLASPASDCFSLGLLIAYVYNQQQGLICSNHSTSIYNKQIEALPGVLPSVLPMVPVQLQEALTRLLNVDPRIRPSSQLLALIKYFSDPVVASLQFLDVVSMKDPSQKSRFYRGPLMETIHYVPSKLWFTHLWPALQLEMRGMEVLAAVLQPIFYLVANCTQQEFMNYILPDFRAVYSLPKSIQATVSLLENMSLVLEKCNAEESVKSEALPMLYNSLDSSTAQVQNSALTCVPSLVSHIDDSTIRHLILPKTKAIYEKCGQDCRMVLSVLNLLESILDKLDRCHIVDDVLPILYDVRLSDPEIVIAVVRIYRHLLGNRLLSINLMATRVLPSLLPQTVNPGLSLDQFSTLISTLEEMIGCIDRNQRNKLKLDHLSVGNAPKSNLKHQRSSELVGSVTVRIDARKAASAEDMVGRGPSPPPNAGPPFLPSDNFLRVLNTPYRRLSDNTLTPSLRLPPPQPTTDDTNLPIRRHSSIGNPEGRKNSVAVAAQSARAGGGSASASQVNSRRTSIMSAVGSSNGTNILQQIGSGVFQLFNQGTSGGSSK